MVLSKGTLFPEALVTDVINSVQGKSSLIKLSQQVPIAFNGNEIFVFSMDNEVDVVAENAPKSHGGVTLTPKSVAPVKVEYGARVSDEFMYASQEARVSILRPFVEGFATKVARGLDIMGIHGVNPRTGTKSEVIGSNNFDDQVTQTLAYDEANPDANIQAAIDLIQGEEKDVNGLALSPTFSSALANYKVNGVKQFPEFAWGQVPEATNGLKVDVNSTVSYGSSEDRAILGDFAGNFKWGYAKEIPMQVIQYGDPDNTGVDLAGHNQVYIRCEAYLGWVILDPLAFARVTEDSE